jgi:hypothetical protein
MGKNIFRDPKMPNKTHKMYGREATPLMEKNHYKMVQLAWICTV